MRNRRNGNRRGIAAAASGAVASIWRHAFTRAARRPVDSLAILGAIVLSFVIIVNAAYLQSGSHPAPFFADAARVGPASRSATATQLRHNTSGTAMPKAVQPAASTPSATGAPTSQAAPVRHSDPIAELIGVSVRPTSRVAAVQRVLSEYGYGQVTPSGTLDEATRAAIEKFERQYRLPVTGRVSDRLLSELAAMTGRSLP